MTFKINIEADGATFHVASVVENRLAPSIAISVDDGVDVFMSISTAHLLSTALMAAVASIEEDKDV